MEETMFIDPQRCIGCRACVAACRECATHKGYSMIFVDYIDRAETTATMPTLCMHCKEPTCALVCPADAIKVADDGVVMSALKPRCLDCRNCVNACPFGVPKYNTQIHLQMKCDMCYDRSSEGLKPMCASVCPTGAISFGKYEQIVPLRRTKWVVYCKDPFAGPEQVLRYLSRYTDRVAISNRRLVSADDKGVAFRWKDYRSNGAGRWKTMTLSPHEFIRRFLMHVLPKGFHRIRHYGLFANGNRTANTARARELLGVSQRVVEPEQEKAAAPDEPRVLPCPCPRCGGRMIVIEVFVRGCQPSYRPTPIRIDTS